MEEMEKNELPQEEGPSGYAPRPRWQIWAARVGVVIVLVAFLLYCWHIANGGSA